MTGHAAKWVSIYIITGLAYGDNSWVIDMSFIHISNGCAFAILSFGLWPGLMTYILLGLPGRNCSAESFFPR